MRSQYLRQPPRLLVADHEVQITPLGGSAPVTITVSSSASSMAATMELTSSNPSESTYSHYLGKMKRLCKTARTDHSINLRPLQGFYGRWPGRGGLGTRCGLRPAIGAPRKAKLFMIKAGWPD